MKYEPLQHKRTFGLFVNIGSRCKFFHYSDAKLGAYITRIAGAFQKPGPFREAPLGPSIEVFLAKILLSGQCRGFGQVVENLAQLKPDTVSNMNSENLKFKRP